MSQCCSMLIVLHARYLVREYVLQYMGRGWRMRRASAAGHLDTFC